MGEKLRIIAVDDEANNLAEFEIEIQGLEDVELAGMFQSTKEALLFAEKHSVDAAFLDISMPGMSGIELGKKLRELCPDIILIYLTAYRKYAYDAFKLEAVDYVLKPYNREDLEKALSRARKQKKVQNADRIPKVRIRTFGRFEVFVGEEPIDFSSSKAKELLALCVDRRGGIVTTEEMLAFLWEDRPDGEKSRSLCRKVIQRLHRTLDAYGAGDILIRHRRGRSLDMDKVSCDYYEYLKKGDEQEPPEEYMSNYSWGEMTLGRLLMRGGVTEKSSFEMMECTAHILLF